MLHNILEIRKVAETRHVYDIAFGIKILLLRGILYQNISVMDSFKYALINTNEALKDIKKKDNFQSLLEQSQLTSLLQRLHAEDVKEDDKNNLQLEIQSLEKMLEIRYVVQGPWILNASIAMSTIF